ncbi:MAG: NAD-dependent succinate-semialdehyde dehydrogenase [Gammaproteobacteria bacterium]|nr:NAD-dependent succinate-semialdehyde dehydrogenase [Gammaproteobacteria bacterium]
MAIQSINPATGEVVKEFASWTDSELDRVLALVAEETPAWATRSIAERSALIVSLGKVLRSNSDKYAGLISLEMGKLKREALAEIEKCALACDYYSTHADDYLADEVIETDASRSMITYLPLGTVLAVMPWNFPFWQVLRFAVSAITAGNTVVLKHASNVPQSALAIEEAFRQAGFPENVFTTLMIGASQVKAVIEDPRIHGVTLTGSEAAGRIVASQAGAAMKKSVLELGGSDPFIVLEDCDMEWTVSQAIASRFGNCGQVCIAAKRFILVESIADEFVQRFKAGIEKLVVGDPADEATTIGPMSRTDLRDELHQQVTDSIQAGAKPLTGCAPLEGAGAYYQPSLLDHVKPGMRAYDEEFFGPVAIIIRVRDEMEAIRIANDSRFGLGSSIWTQNIEKGESLSRLLHTGSTFINGLVKSDPRLPVGGVRASGYGRELSRVGMYEWCNIKTLWIK